MGVPPTSKVASVFRSGGNLGTVTGRFSRQTILWGEKGLTRGSWKQLLLVLSVLVGWIKGWSWHNRAYYLLTCDGENGPKTQGKLLVHDDSGQKRQRNHMLQRSLTFSRTRGDFIIFFFLFPFFFHDKKKRVFTSTPILTPQYLTVENLPFPSALYLFFI